MKHLSWAAVRLVVAYLWLCGCTSVAQMTTLSDQNCRHAFVDRVSSILVEEGEQQDMAAKLAESTVTVLSSGTLGPARSSCRRPPARTTASSCSKSRSVFCGCSTVSKASRGTRTI